jgi:TPR repeat protein
MIRVCVLAGFAVAVLSLSIDAGTAAWDGKGVKQHQKQAEGWNQKARALTQNELGGINEDGKGVEPDLSFGGSVHQAARLYRRAKHGDAVAQSHLGENYFFGQGGVKQDYTQAKVWWQKAAEQAVRGGEGAHHAGLGLSRLQIMHVGSAQFNLGDMYREGEGVEKDPNMAVKWYRKAAEGEGGDPILISKALNNLGVMYDTGDGVEQDHEEAAAMFQKAEELAYQHGFQNSLSVAARATLRRKSGAPQYYFLHKLPGLRKLYIDLMIISKPALTMGLNLFMFLVEWLVRASPQFAGFISFVVSSLGTSSRTFNLFMAILACFIVFTMLGVIWAVYNIPRLWTRAVNIRREWSDKWQRKKEKQEAKQRKADETNAEAGH